MLTLYTDEFQMLLQKSYIVLYLTEPGVQNAKEKSLPSTKGQASKDICWMGKCIWANSKGSVSKSDGLHQTSKPFLSGRPVISSSDDSQRKNVQMSQAGLCIRK